MTPPHTEGMKELRDFLFTYRWNGAEFGMTVRAYSETEAFGRVSQMSLARFEGVVHAEIPLTLKGILTRLFRALKSRAALGEKADG